MRRAFADFIAEKVKQDRRIHVLTMDFAKDQFSELIKYFPGNHWNFGVKEQATVAVAAGMAQEGLKPYIIGITPFALERPYEFIKLDIVAQNVDVKIIGYGDYPNDGPTHITKDVKGTCANLELKVYSPKDSMETRELLEKTYRDNFPAFFNLKRDPNYQK
tara:strand:- start:109 stop:591 length:483 start_codon:yes stop_codon:yes gene_type:complete